MSSKKFSTFNVLIVDDEPLMRNLVREVLNKFGFPNVWEANGGRKAQELIEMQAFDFIITDWRMDDLDGIDIVNFVRGSKKPPLCHTPIIMLTGNTETHYVKAAIAAGVNSYVIKPFSAEHLARRICDIIEHPREFVISPKYVGPDRRHITMRPPRGVERRKRKKHATQRKQG